jgi:hypothetical protein
MRIPHLLVLFTLLSGCMGQAGGGDEVVCDHPYIRFGSECCLDRDVNDVCDRDETTTTRPAPPPTAPTTVPTTLATTTTLAPTTTRPRATTTLAPTRTVAPTTTTVTITVTTTTRGTTTTQFFPCMETDGGEDIYVFGTIKRGSHESQRDRCASSASLNEFYCDENRIAMRLHQCPTGCADGRCLGCEDSDGGDKPNTYGEVTLGSLTKKDICSNRDGVTLTEFYCVGPEEVGSRQVACTTSCDGGYCH